MKKPEKKEVYNSIPYEVSYNQACDDWEAYHDWFIKEQGKIATEMINWRDKKINQFEEFLPSEEELHIILDKYNVVGARFIAKAIAKRKGKL